MFGSPRNAVQMYAKVGLETNVIASNPHQLITLLFEGALVAIGKARRHMQAGEIEEKGATISKALMIIESGLRSGLSLKAGGDVAKNLDSLYVFMTQQLMFANLNNQVSKLDEVSGLLADLKSAWDAIGPTGQPGSPYGSQPGNECLPAAIKA